MLGGGLAASVATGVRHRAPTGRCCRVRRRRTGREVALSWSMECHEATSRSPADSRPGLAGHGVGPARNADGGPGELLLADRILHHQYGVRRLLPGAWRGAYPRLPDL